MRPGYKQTEVGVIPEDWEVVTLGDVGDSLIGLTYSPVDVRRSGVLVLRSSNIQNDALAFDDNVFVSRDIPERIMVRPGDVLICVRNGSRDLIGKSALLDHRTTGMTFGAFMAVYRSKIGPLVAYHLQSGVLQRQINEHLGATINQITNKSLNSFRIPLPIAEAEQRAIAAALGDVDAAVAGLERLIAKKRDLKQAAMQQLLTGQTRLPGFSGAWEVKRLGELAHLYQPETIGQAVFTASGYPVYGANGVVGFFDRFNHADPQLMVSCRGNCGTVNRSFGPAWITGNAMVIGLKEKDRVGHFEFMYHLLASTDFSLVITGSGQPQIVRGPLSDLELRLPKEVNEQTAIATVLSDMDAELAALQAQLDKTRLIKQAMIQDLLTGRVRLPFQ